MPRCQGPESEHRVRNPHTPRDSAAARSSAYALVGSAQAMNPARSWDVHCDATSEAATLSSRAGACSHRRCCSPTASCRRCSGCGWGGASRVTRGLRCTVRWCCMIGSTCSFGTAEASSRVSWATCSATSGNRSIGCVGAVVPVFTRATTRGASSIRTPRWSAWPAWSRHRLGRGSSHGLSVGRACICTPAMLGARPRATLSRGSITVPGTAALVATPAPRAKPSCVTRPSLFVRSPSPSTRHAPRCSAAARCST